MSGLELLRSLAADGTPPVTVALVDWADEEGARFSRSLFGSAASVGTLDIDVLRGLTDKEGNKLPEVLAEHGVDIENLDGARTRMADVKAYVEVHIEQGPILESMGRGICTVTGTKGIERERLIFRGQAAHAGTMPMEMRRDSFRAAARFALEIAEIGVRHDGVTTVGSAQCWPGVVTAVAGETRITMDMRHIDAGALAGDVRRGARCRRRAPPRRRAARSSGSTSSASRRCRSTRRCSTRRAQSVREVEGHDVELPSGALHDASEMAREVPTVMIFSSSIDRPQPHQGGGHARSSTCTWPPTPSTAPAAGPSTWSSPASSDHAFGRRALSRAVTALPSALPWLAFITAPTRAPIALPSPATELRPRVGVLGDRLIDERARARRRPSPRSPSPRRSPRRRPRRWRRARRARPWPAWR